MSFVVAIDGPAGSGKGTVTKLVGEKLGFVTFDTGAMYRAVSYYVLKNSINLEDKNEINKMLEDIDIKLEFEDRVQILYLNTERLVKELRTKEVNEIVSQVSHIPEVRTAMVDFQRKLANGIDVILEGRDIGTNVFPNADVKIYLDASAEERANRRLKQNLENGIDNISYEDILENIKFRDNNDKASSIAPLKQAEDAIYIDSSNLSIEEVVQKIVDIIEQKRKQK
ncbi:MAG: (d)CMP kinase [Clostridia bacterium]|nr:(d)CMP kinase [Clostridia bacterium]